MSADGFVKFSKSFKKYTSEYRKELVDAVREFVRGKAEFIAHEDASLLKVTGRKADIDTLCTTMRARFGPLPGDETPKENAKA